MSDVAPIPSASRIVDETSSDGPKTLRAELREIAALGGPITLSFVANQLLGFVDTAMVGRLGATSLAAVGIGNGIFFSITVLFMGLILGMDPLVSQAEGAGDRHRARAVLGQAVRLGFLLSVPCMALLVIAGLLIGRAGIDAETSQSVLHFLLGRLPNIVPFLLITACRVYLQARGLTRALVWSAVWANVTNIIFNILLIYGDDGLVAVGLPRVGLPALGVLGSGLASSLASFVAFGVVFREIVRREGAIRAEELRVERETTRTIVRVGWPIGTHLLAEVGAFSIAGIFAGWIGPQAAAGHQVALSLASLSFTIALGMSNATSVLVGRAVGRGDSTGARHVGLVGIVATSGVMGLSALLFAAAPAFCARILSDKPDVIEAAIPLIRIAAIFQLADGAQAVAAGALRGTGDTTSARNANVVGYYAFGIPLALLLGFAVRMGAVGIWWGLTAALFVVATALVVRFARLTPAQMKRV
ncbi:MATE family efflux transporter [Polyangium jinanense]|uniref:Multidrug-efflux transporter n=1 Tax=Polyangium jinanense TaxID=2829994 RepID=A0A9X3X2H6_9BACT|nr:MATE family efflux transporter [Polyangium jinanense]MDC3956176.1 MATE family efflux transporter [Polyangium jinanense]MDC3982989.1 MATE family efflux transporter [Polyangium jinanense]